MISEPEAIISYVQARTKKLRNLHVQCDTLVIHLQNFVTFLGHPIISAEIGVYRGACVASFWC